MKLFVITARVVYEKDGRQKVKQVLQFLLSDRQVRNEYQAQEFARHVVDPLGLAKEVHVVVNPLVDVEDRAS
jgi:hypothetical protein